MLQAIAMTETAASVVDVAVAEVGAAVRGEGEAADVEVVADPRALVSPSLHLRRHHSSNNSHSQGTSSSVVLPIKKSNRASSSRRGRPLHRRSSLPQLLLLL
jgi:hypothetical protein